MAYDHHLQGMQMADMLIKPRIANLDPALGNIFNGIYARYRSTPSEQIIRLGKEYHAQIFEYLDKKLKHWILIFRYGNVEKSYQKTGKRRRC